MSKKNTVILIIIVAILVLALGIFLLFFTSPNIQNPSNQSTNSPFGNYNGPSSTTSSLTNGTSSNPREAVTQYVNNPTSPLLKISTAPIAGAEAFDRKVTGTTTASIVRYTERATGHTMEYNRSTYILEKASNKTIPGIYQALWSGNTVLAQYLDQDKSMVRTFTGSLPPATTPTTTLSGNIGLNNNIYALAVSPKGNRVFTLPKGDNAIGSISNLDGTQKTAILNFPFNEWSAQWPNENTLTLTTKASSGVPGFMYFLSTGGSMTKALGDIAGLTTNTSPSLGHTIYSASKTGSLSAGVYDFAKNATFDFADRPTLSEKCVWSKLSKTIAYCAVPTSIPNGDYPDDWYQGNISFVDNIYKVDLSLPAIQILYRLPADQSIDAINLFLDAKEENLYFTNKNDYFLWGLALKNI